MQTQNRMTGMRPTSDIKQQTNKETDSVGHWLGGKCIYMPLNSVTCGSMALFCKTLKYIFDRIPWNLHNFGFCVHRRAVKQETIGKTFSISIREVLFRFVPFLFTLLTCQHHIAWQEILFSDKYNFSFLWVQLSI